MTKMTKKPIWSLAAEDGEADAAAAAEGEGEDGDADLEFAAEGEDGAEEGDADLELAAEGEDGGETEDAGLELAADDGNDADEGAEEGVDGGLGEIAGEALDDGADPEQVALAEIAAQVAIEAGEDPNEAFQQVLSGEAALDDILETAAGGEDTGALGDTGLVPADDGGGDFDTGNISFGDSVFSFDSGGGLSGLTGLGGIVQQVTLDTADDDGPAVVEEAVVFVDTTAEAPEVSAADAVGAEDTVIPLSIDVADVAPGSRTRR